MRLKHLKRRADDRSAHWRQSSGSCRSAGRGKSTKRRSVTIYYNMGMTSRRLAFWADLRAIWVGWAVDFCRGRGFCGKKAVDIHSGYPHNSISSLLTQRRDERHSLPISVMS